MNNEENLKKSLQQLVESKEFPFDEAEWNKAAAIIDAGKEGKRRRALYWFAAASLLLLLGFYAYMSSGSAAPASQNMAALPTPAETNNKTAEESKAPAPPAEITTAPEVSNTVPMVENTNPVAPAPAAPVQKKAAKNPAATPIQKVSHSTPVEPVQMPMANNQPAKQAPAAESKPVKTTKAGSNSDNKNNKQEPTVTTDPLAQQSMDVKPAEVKPDKVADQPPVQSNDTGSGTMTTVSQNANAPESSTTVAEDKSTTSEQKADAPAETPTVAQSPAPAKKDSVPVAKTTPPADSTKVALPTPTVSLLRNFFNIEGGVAYLNGWKNPDSRDAQGFNGVLGVNFYSLIATKFYFGLGVQYNSVRNLAYSQKTSKLTRYRLGEESEVTIITPQTLHYLTVPFKLNYQLNTKNAFGIGCNVGYLLNVVSKVDTYTESMNGIENMETYTTAGYTEGFRLFDTQMNLFYRRQVFGALWANAEFFVGLNDTKNNVFFKSNAMERNTGLKLTLSYNLYTK